MPDKSYGWHNYPLLPVSELNRRGIETTFDHNARIQAENERENCLNRRGSWSTMSDGQYCILRAAYMAYTHENDTLSIMRHYSFKWRRFYDPMWRDVKKAQQRIVDSHWKTFVDLSRIYARMDK